MIHAHSRAGMCVEPARPREVRKDRQEPSSSCGGYHGNFPDCHTVNGSRGIWPSVAFVCVGDAFLFDREGSLKVEEQKADSAAVRQRSQMDRALSPTQRSPRPAQTGICCTEYTCQGCTEGIYPPTGLNLHPNRLQIAQTGCKFD